jgi:hypothetical protein
MLAQAGLRLISKNYYSKLYAEFLCEKAVPEPVAESGVARLPGDLGPR